MYAKLFSIAINVINGFTQQTRCFVRDPFPNKVTHYLHRAKLIDSIRLSLRLDPSSSLPPLLNSRTLDSFVVTHAFRSAPSADSALFLNEKLKSVQHFSHTETTVHALAKVLAKSHRSAELKSLIDAINDGMFRNVCVSNMDLMQWYAAAGDLESVLGVWKEYRCSNERTCTESYNIVMRLCAQAGKNSEAVQIFHSMVDEGAIPNSRTYTIMIEHLMNLGKKDSAMEVFRTLPFMRMKHTVRQYLVLVEGLAAAGQVDEVTTLLNEMRADGILPGRAMRMTLEQLQEAGLVQETDDFLREMLPDERIKNIGCCGDSSDEDDGVNQASGGANTDEVELKPWLDPRALANALNVWSPDEVSALEDAKFVWTTRLVCKILRHFKSPETAWNFFCWVSFQPEFMHDIYTVQRMMAILARHGHAELVDRLLSKVRKEGMRLPLSTIRLIIEFYGIAKNADAALKVFHDDRTLCGPISKFNLTLLYSSLLRTLTKCGRDSSVMDVLEEMASCSLFPDIQTVSGLMHHFALQGEVKSVQKLFLMVRQSGVKPDAYMFKLLIQAYCKCERASLAWRVFEEMRNSSLMPDAATKELLVKSLWKEGKRREAAAVEESCEEINDVLPRVLRGHKWAVSSQDLIKIYNIYSNSFS